MPSSPAAAPGAKRLFAEDHRAGAGGLVLAVLVDPLDDLPSHGLGGMEADGVRRGGRATHLPWRGRSGEDG